MTSFIAVLAMANAAVDRPSITCAVNGTTITVRFNEPNFHTPVIDKFAILQGTLQAGEWLRAVDDDIPPSAIT